MWQTVEEFADWYKSNNYPIRPPFEDPIYVTDISYSYVLFREGQFQVELYLVRPNTSSPEHSHPGVENIVLLWGGDIGDSENTIFPAVLGLQGPTIRNGSTHALYAGNKGCAVLSIEKWADGMKPTSVSINWVGDPCGDIHHRLIKDESNIV
jgi:hypothetical protein